MKRYKSRYIEILAVESEDLEDDIAEMERIKNRRFKLHEITQYVTLENISLLSKEIEGIKEIIKQLKSVDSSQFPSLDELIKYIDNLVCRIIKEQDLPESVHNFIKRKLIKVKDFVLID